MQSNINEITKFTRNQNKYCKVWYYRLRDLSYKDQCIRRDLEQDKSTKEDSLWF